MKKTVPWTAAEKDIVKQGWANGLSFSRIAARLKGRSRSAVCGLVQREGWNALRPSTPQRATEVKISKRPPPARETGPRRVLRSPDRQVAVAALKPPAAAPPAPPPEALNLRLEDLGPGQCRYPVAGERPPYLFCGAPAQGSWCAHHKHRIRSKASAAEEAPEPVRAGFRFQRVPA
ncbi:GcrA family cell cycle regulator [Acidiphilium sp.]|uniref:GcrA family cell cycle regulator n=1 Tax=Acidiphilium sp. TaxID=527 RepID=UPI0025868B56|nr:GcrA family cell cycle regulator [Acidiphilium sp.]